MRVFSHLLALLTLVIPSILAVTLSGQIQFGNLITRETLPVGSKVSINHGERKVWIKGDGSFEISNVDEGEYILEPIIPGYIFNSYFITIESIIPIESNSPINSNSNSNSKSDSEISISSIEPTFIIHIQPFYPSKLPLPINSISLNHPLIITPLSKEDYFINKGGMNILGMLKSPMVLMMLFSAIMLFALPKLTAALADDPEMAKEMADTRARMNNFQSMDLAGSLSNMLAGSSENAPVTNTIQASSGSNTPNRSGANAGGKKRRGR
ncbi:uncharacterized protein I206_102755 [Kwoniella pini CBS 10737]|uniref:ER membrane protein complex subunit 7 beta-sandwich domain-containing protein n=1 Tax=Kwoniella pini CBS 10737 TaxID=1296096 RepID=A0A1B9I682_9TREE|nr:uncharacterized protein I206_03110 [Kwoniella pini CBS 10737]OCF51045.1 hypothetical protein I206_03110 [Kwoniella pini CBS 10737]